MFNIRVSSNTDVGDVKQTNQDCILVKHSLINNHSVGLFIVADGCGGMAYGEEVSNLVVTHFSRVWNHELKDMLLSQKIKETEVEALLEKAIQEINSGAIFFGKQVDSKVGSTLSLLLTIDNMYIIKNVGDSRIYRARKKKITQLTQDQSLVADLIRNGEITREEAKNFGKKNVLTMCIGVFEDIKTYTRTGKIKHGDTFVVCCDGLHNKVDESKMIALLDDKAQPFENVSKRLRDAISRGDANDNVSSVICRFEKERRFAFVKMVGIVGVLCALLATIWYFAGEEIVNFGVKLLK